MNFIIFFLSKFGIKLLAVIV